MSEQWQVQIPMGPHVYDPSDQLAFRVVRPGGREKDYFYICSQPLQFRPWFWGSWYSLYLNLLVKAIRAVAKPKIAELKKHRLKPLSRTKVIPLSSPTVSTRFL